jgi:hypothetical protein
MPGSTTVTQSESGSKLNSVPQEEQCAFWQLAVAFSVSTAPANANSHRDWFMTPIVTEQERSPLTPHCKSALLQCEARRDSMTNWSALVEQLKKERDAVELQLSGLNSAIRAFAGVYSGTTKQKRKGRMSAAGRRRISLAQKARWAKYNAPRQAKPKRTMSASARRKIAAAQRARWAKVKRAAG